MGLIETKIIRVINKKMGERQKGESKGLSQQSGSLYVVIEKWGECGGH